MERPTYFVEFNEKIKGDFCDDILSIDVRVFIYCFEKILGFFDIDNLIFASCVNMTMTQEHFASIRFAYEPATKNSTVYTGTNDWGLEASNVTIMEMQKIGGYEDEAYIVSKVLNSPCYLKTQCYWAFWDSSTQKHELQIKLEVVYFNGTLYKKIVVPIVLWLWLDAGENFETARTIDAGTFIGSLHYQLDYIDFYKIMLKEGETIDIKMTPKPHLDPNFAPDYDLYLYDPNEQLKASSCTEGDMPITEHVTFTADSTGYWYIKVQHQSASLKGTYLLDITTPSRR